MLILNDKSASPIPEPIAQLQRQLDAFRSARPHRARLPEVLWQSAVELAKQHGVYSVAHPLRLDYTQLKKRLEGVPGPQEKATAPNGSGTSPTCTSRAQFRSSICITRGSIFGSWRANYTPTTLRNRKPG
jgi:hypothetical protein